MTDFIKLVENVGLAQNELFDAYESMAYDCFARGDVEGASYWFGRAHTITEEKYRLIDDLGQYIQDLESKET